MIIVNSNIIREKETNKGAPDGDGDGVRIRVGSGVVAIVGVVVSISSIYTPKPKMLRAGAELCIAKVTKVSSKVVYTFIVK